MAILPDLQAFLTSLTCSICGIKGHRAPQCWVNLAVYDWARTTDNMAHNYNIRSSMRIAQRQAQNEVKRTAENTLLLATETSKVSL